MLKKVKSYIKNHLNPVKKKIIDPKKMYSLSIPEIFADNDYYRILSISKDDDFELHLKTKPNSCFINSYFNDGLKAWRSNLFSLSTIPVLKSYEGSFCEKSAQKLQAHVL